jgi:HlyD family secretion protein
MNPARCSPVRSVALLAALALVPVSLLAGCGRDADTIHASGIIEMDEIDVGSLVGGRIARLTVDEGDSVSAGDTLAVIDREEIAAEFEVQAAQAERAAAQSREVAIGPRAQEVRAARAQLTSAQTQLDLAEADLARTEELFRSQVSSQAELDRARAARGEALGQRDAARERLAELEAGSRKDEIVAARQAATAARASAAGARSRLRELVLTAPISGVVLLRNFEPGELAGPSQPVLTLGNPDSLWLRVYIPAPDLARIRRGSAAVIHLTGVRETFPGRVVEIGTRAEFTPRAALTEEERANIVFPVKIALAASGGVLKAGLPADARIEGVTR